MELPENVSIKKKILVEILEPDLIAFDKKIGDNFPRNQIIRELIKGFNMGKFKIDMKIGGNS